MLGPLWSSACSSTLSNLDRGRQIWSHVITRIADLGLAGVRACTLYSTPMTMDASYPSCWHLSSIVSAIPNEAYPTLSPYVEFPMWNSLCGTPTKCYNLSPIAVASNGDNNRPDGDH